MLTYRQRYRGGAVYAEGCWMSGVHRFLDQCVLPFGFTQSELYEQPIPHSLNADWNRSTANAHERACNITEAGRMHLGCQVHAALKRLIDRRRKQGAQTDTSAWFSVAMTSQTSAKRRPPTAVCNALRALDSHSLCPVAAEVEVYWWPARLGTRIDLLCIDRLTNALVPVELKTRRSPQAAVYARCQGRPLRYPFNKYDANLANLHFVQTFVGQILLEKTIERLFLATPGTSNEHPVTALRQILADLAVLVNGDGRGCCARMPRVSPAAVLYVGSADTQAVLQFVPGPMLEQKLALQLFMSRTQSSSSLPGTSVRRLSTPHLFQPTLSKPPRPFGSTPAFSKCLRQQHKRKRDAPSKRPRSKKDKTKMTRKRAKLEPSITHINNKDSEK